MEHIDCHTTALEQIDLSPVIYDLHDFMEIKIENRHGIIAAVADQREQPFAGC